jgi:hypothetical protein
LSPLENGEKKKRPLKINTQVDEPESRQVEDPEEGEQQILEGFGDYQK